MITLDEILNIAIVNGACYPQLSKFQKLIAEKDEVQAWQTILYFCPWLEKCGLVISKKELKEIHKKANGLGKCWWGNGKPYKIVTYNNKRQLDGISYEYYDTGQILSEQPYKNDFVHGVSVFYSHLGDVLYKRTHKEGYWVPNES